MTHVSQAAEPSQVAKVPRAAELPRGAGLPRAATVMAVAAWGLALVSVAVLLTARPAVDEGSLFFLVDDKGGAAAMGGLRTLPDGAAEIVRIFTRPEYRGQGCGAMMVRHLIAEAGRMGQAVIRLDTGIFMRSAQRIYEAEGFVRRGPYEGAEPPAVLRPYWIYMERGTVQEPAAEAQTG